MYHENMKHKKAVAAVLVIDKMDLNTLSVKIVIS